MQPSFVKNQSIWPWTHTNFQYCVLYSWFCINYTWIYTNFPPTHTELPAPLFYYIHLQGGEKHTSSNWLYLEFLHFFYLAHLVCVNIFSFTHTCVSCPCEVLSPKMKKFQIAKHDLLETKFTNLNCKKIFLLTQIIRKGITKFLWMN